MFRDDPYEVRLVDLGLRAGERFLYEYDFIDGQVPRRAGGGDPPGRASAALPGLHRRPALRPAGGLRGPWAFMDQRQHYSPLRLIELLAELLEADPNERVREVLGDRYEEPEELSRWLRLDRFDRRAANRRLAEAKIDRARSPA